jgi:predicted outer membrane lipoprotein
MNMTILGTILAVAFGYIIWYLITTKGGKSSAKGGGTTKRGTNIQK